MPRKTLLSLFVLFCVSTGAAVASAQNCNPPAITANSQIYNIFSPEQEMILGDLNHQRMSGDLRFMQDEKLMAYVRQIGEKLTRHLPPTRLKFQFFIIDIPTANAFNTPRRLRRIRTLQFRRQEIIRADGGPGNLRLRSRSPYQTRLKRAGGTKRFDLNSHNHQQGVERW